MLEAENKIKGREEQTILNFRICVPFISAENPFKKNPYIKIKLCTSPLWWFTLKYCFKIKVEH